jgi:hypothetical protein
LKAREELKIETTPALTDEQVADRAAVKRMADEVWWLVFAVRQGETLQ